MARYCIHLAYRGTNYCGWQRQPNAPSVQGQLEEAVSMLLHVPVNIVGCGRTDTGVHASDFYAHFDTEACVDEQLMFKLNSFLPADIAIFNVARVPENFHARFSARSRTYRYYVSNRRLPFKQGLYTRIYYAPNVAAMNEAAELLKRHTDFSSFAKSHTQVKTNICELMEAHWASTDEGWLFQIKANRFLRNMVRSIVGTLLDVGRGKLSLEGVEAIVNQKQRSAAGASMPADGLFLAKVDYDWSELAINKPFDNLSVNEIH